MPEDNTKNKPKLNVGNVFPWLAGVGLCAAFAGPMYWRYAEHENFLKKDVVTLEGTVIGENYSQQISGGLGCGGSSSHGQYVFSIDDPVRGRVGIEVMDSCRPRVN